MMNVVLIKIQLCTVFSKAVSVSKPGIPQYTAHRLPEKRKVEKTCLEQQQQKKPG